MTVPATEHAVLEAAARDAVAVGGLHVRVDRPSRWPWFRDWPLHAHVTEDGGCSCSLLADGASWEDEAWEFRPDLVEALAATLQTLAAGLPDGATVEALWAGDQAHATQRVTPAQLADAVRQGLGTGTCYVIVSAGPACPPAAS